MRELVSDEVKKMQSELLELCNSYAEVNGNFNMDFVHSLQEAFIKYGSLTPKQHSALSNIADKFKMWEKVHG